MPFLLFQKSYFAVESLTDPGLKRDCNEDAVFCGTASGCFAVSDGMGGADAGAQASGIVISSLRDFAATPAKNLSRASRAVYRANQEIREAASRHHWKGTGATVAGLVLDPFNPQSGYLFSAGDSRAYLYRDGALKQLTNDHTVSSAMGVDESTLPKHMQGVLTNVVGVGANFFLDAGEVPIRKGDLFLLCTDGLTRQVPDKKIRGVLAENRTLREKLEKLSKSAADAGGIDNLSVILLQFADLPAVTADVEQEKQNLPDEEDEEAENDATPPTE